MNTEYKEFTSQTNNFIFGLWKAEFIENDSNVLIKIFIGDDKIRIIKKVNGVEIENELFPKSTFWSEEWLLVSGNFFVRKANEKNLIFGEFRENMQMISPSNIKWYREFERVEEAEWLHS